MKNSKDHIDKLFKDKLENQSFDIPSEFIADLNTRLDEVDAYTRRRRRGWFILNSLFLFLFISLFFVDFTHQSTKLTNATESSVQDSFDSKDSFSKGKLTSKSEITNQSEGLKNSEKEAKSRATDNAMSKTTYNGNSTPKDRNNKTTYGPENTGQHNVTKGVGVQKEAKGVTNAENEMTVSANDSGESTTRYNSTPTPKDQNNNTKYSPENPTQHNSAKGESTSKETKNGDTADATPKANRGDHETKNNRINSFPPDTVVIRDTVFVYDTLSVRDTVVIIDTVKVKEPNTLETKQAKLTFDLQLFSGLSYGGQTLSQSTAAGTNYLITYSPLFTPSFGFNINASWNNVTIGTGLEYLQIGEEYTVNSITVTESDSLEIVGFDIDTVIFNQQTQTTDTIFTPIYDSVTYSDSITTTNNWVNSYSWLSIPLNLGYRYDIGKWAIIPKAGFTFNFGMRNSNGQYPDISSSPVSILDSPAVLFNLDYLLQLEIRRSIGKAMLYVSPNFRGNLTPVTLDAESRKYNSFGLRFGVAIPL